MAKYDDGYEGADGERPVETSPEGYQAVNPASIRELREAGRLTLKIRKLSAERKAATIRRRALLLSATTRRPNRAKYPLASRMVGLAISVITREVGYARDEADAQEGAA